MRPRILHLARKATSVLSVRQRSIRQIELYLGARTLPLADWIDDLVPANARVSTLESDPSSIDYGNPVVGADFPVGYQKMSSTEIQRIGRQYGTDLFIILCDLNADGSVPVAKEAVLNVDGLGDLDVEAIVDFQQADERMVRVEAVKH